MKKRWNINTLSLAFCIGIFPPLWAVLAPYIRIYTGATALICAGLYVANGNKKEDAVKITTGFWLGDLWAWLAIHIMNFVRFNPDLELFLTLLVLGAAAVILSDLLSKWVFCPAWLCGWAIGLTIMSELNIAELNGYALQIAAAMLVGVWYVGVFVNYVQKKIADLLGE